MIFIEKTLLTIIDSGDETFANKPEFTSLKNKILKIEQNNDQKDNKTTTNPYSISFNQWQNQNKTENSLPTAKSQQKIIAEALRQNRQAKMDKITGDHLRKSKLNNIHTERKENLSIQNPSNQNKNSK